MFEDYQICPYTGLRSFTEEESIYFKGRDDHIQQSTALLERNKFIMLTGASGDGKSSLVFAGIIPNAKSGFLKSKYSNWSVVSFRPERTPLRNLSQSLAEQLDIPSTETVESELTHGFSALVDLYKSSKRYLDENSNEWVHSNDTEKAAIKRESSNLIILVDQFEEFFTNPENYHRGNPSTESSLTVNLLLETARLALEEDLPIYIVFTMRSDYIGQCAAFRGLPEYIGFSQFFVPRLNRAQLQQVIEEPAKLSGNKISRRLSERLILDITEDVDQLPILQHALSQIWSKASNGVEEMDLLHYTMVGGMSPSDLPTEDIANFEKWFSNLSKKIRACYKKPSLHNVIDTHANKLLVFSQDYYFEKAGVHIDENTANVIVKAVFTCLTKIDQSRAVRNRMTLGEINDVIGRPDIDTKIIGIVLDQFREPGNTFFRPFMSEVEVDRLPLQDDDVLDITHESLIRNWAVLGNWAQEEFQHYTTHQDFYQQVERWVSHDKSRGFLLPIGPLTYFENWFKQLNPNAYWVNRYLKNNDERESTLKKAKEIISNSKEYLKRSATKHAVTRMVMHYGPKKLAAVLAILALMVFSSFYVVEMMSRRNDAVLAKIEKDALELFENENTTLLNKQIYVLFQERLNPGAFENILSQLPNDLERARVATGVAIEIVVNDSYSGIPLKKKSILYADSLLGVILSKQDYDKKEVLKVLIDFVDVSEYTNYHLDDPDLNKVLELKAKSLSKLVMDIILNGKGSNWNVKELNEGIELSLNHKAYSEDDIAKLIKVMSPFEGEQNEFLATLYDQNKLIETGANDDKFTFNGLYQELLYLYASQGNVDLAMRCVDTLQSYHSNYNGYAVDGYTATGYFVTYDHWDSLETYVSLYSKKSGHPEFIFYERILDRCPKISRYLPMRFESILFFRTNIWHNPALEYQTMDVALKLFDLYYMSIIENAHEGDEKEFALALFHKRKGVTLAKWEEDKNKRQWKAQIDSAFESSLAHFDMVSDNYLDQIINETSYAEFTRKTIFKYPDYFETEFVYSQRSDVINFKSVAFMNWLIKTDRFNNFFSDNKELEQITFWLSSNMNNSFNFNCSAVPLNISTLMSIDSELTQHEKSDLLDKNLLYLTLTYNYFKLGLTAEGVDAAGQINPSSLNNILSSPNGFQRSIRFQYICDIYSQLLINKQPDIATKLLSGVENKKNVAGVYGYTATKLFLFGNKALGTSYLDSARSIIDNLRSINPNFWDFRKNISYAIALSSAENSKFKAQQLTRNMQTFTRHLSKGLIKRGIIASGDYYPAYSDFPPFTSSETKLYYINNILYEMVRTQNDDLWAIYHYNYNRFYNVVGHTLD